MPYSFSASLLFGSCFFFFLVDHVCVVAPQTSLFLSCTWSYMDVVSLFIKLGGSLFQGDFVTVEVATCATGVSWLRIVLLWASWSMLKSQWFLVINTSMWWSSNADAYLVHGSGIISVHLIRSSHFMPAFVFFFGGSKTTVWLYICEGFVPGHTFFNDLSLSFLRSYGSWCSSNFWYEVSITNNELICFGNSLLQ
jgi:hypothetical protein